MPPIGPSQPDVEQIAGLAAHDEGRSVGVRGDGVDHAGPRVAIVLVTDGGERLGEEMPVRPATVETQLIGIGLGAAGIVEQMRLGIRIVERRADEGVGIDAVLDPIVPPTLSRLKPSEATVACRSLTPPLPCM
jgi:hypothetical protein